MSTSARYSDRFSPAALDLLDLFGETGADAFGAFGGHQTAAIVEAFNDAVSRTLSGLRRLGDEFERESSRTRRRLRQLSADMRGIHRAEWRALVEQRWGGEICYVPIELEPVWEEPSFWERLDELWRARVRRARGHPPPRIPARRLIAAPRAPGRVPAARHP